MVPIGDSSDREGEAHSEDDGQNELFPVNAGEMCEGFEVHEVVEKSAHVVDTADKAG